MTRHWIHTYYESGKKRKERKYIALNSLKDFLIFFVQILCVLSGSDKRELIEITIQLNIYHWQQGFLMPSIALR
jgi:competence protein ComGF